MKSYITYGHNRKWTIKIEGELSLFSQLSARILLRIECVCIDRHHEISRNKDNPTLRYIFSNEKLHF